MIPKSRWWVRRLKTSTQRFRKASLVALKKRVNYSTARRVMAPEIRSDLGKLSVELSSRRIQRIVTILYYVLHMKPQFRLLHTSRLAAISRTFIRVAMGQRWARRRTRTFAVSRNWGEQW